MDPMSNRDALPNGSPGNQDANVPDVNAGELRGALVAGLLGAVVATAGWVIYNRLEDEHKAAIRKTVAKFVEERVSEVRSQLKL